MIRLSVFLLFILMLVSPQRKVVDVVTVWYEDGSVIDYPIYEGEQGSGIGITPHMRLGPRTGDGLITRPDPPDVHTPPPNDGENGIPVDLPPDSVPAPSTFNCTVVFVNQTSAEKAKYNVACLMIETIVPSAAFQADVLGHRSFNGNVGFYGSSSTCNAAGELGSVNAAVMANILEADEKYPSQAAVDNELDIKIEMYLDSASTTIGYTSQSDDRIHVNRKYSDGFKPNAMASNLFHEWLHKMGYGHSSASTSCRPYSIPYAIGYMIRDYASPLNSTYGY